MQYEGTLWSMGYQENIHQTASHLRAIVLRELTSDHAHPTDNNVHFYKPQRIGVYTHWLNQSKPSESHHTEHRKMILAQIFMKFQKLEWKA